MTNFYMNLCLEILHVILFPQIKLHSKVDEEEVSVLLPKQNTGEACSIIIINIKLVGVTMMIAAKIIALTRTS